MGWGLLEMRPLLHEKLSSAALAVNHILESERAPCENGGGEKREEGLQSLQNSPYRYSDLYGISEHITNNALQSIGRLLGLLLQGGEECKLIDKSIFSVLWQWRKQGHSVHLVMESEEKCTFLKQVERSIEAKVSVRKMTWWGTSQTATETKYSFFKEYIWALESRVEFLVYPHNYKEQGIVFFTETAISETKTTSREERPRPEYRIRDPITLLLDWFLDQTIPESPFVQDSAVEERDQSAQSNCGKRESMSTEREGRRREPVMINAADCQRLESIYRERIEVADNDIEYDSMLSPHFKIDRTAKKCRTPRRNEDCGEAILFMLSCRSWCEEAGSYFLQDLGARATMIDFYTADASDVAISVAPFYYSMGKDAIAKNGEDDFICSKVKKAIVDEEDGRGAEVGGGGKVRERKEEEENEEENEEEEEEKEVEKEVERGVSEGEELEKKGSCRLDDETSRKKINQAPLNCGVPPQPVTNKLFSYEGNVIARNLTRVRKAVGDLKANYTREWEENNVLQQKRQEEMDHHDEAQGSRFIYGDDGFSEPPLLRKYHLSPKGGCLLLLLAYMEQTATAHVGAMDEMESVMYNRLCEVIGKVLSEEDFQEYFDNYHVPRVLAPTFPDRLCYSQLSYPLRLSTQSPFGDIAIHRTTHSARVPTLTPPFSFSAGAPIPCFSKQYPIPSSSPMSFRLSASTTVSFSGIMHVHAHLRHTFSSTISSTTPSRRISQMNLFPSSQSAQLLLRARARPFKSFMLLLGLLEGERTFCPKRGIIIKDGDEIDIPLLLDLLPTPKEFKEAVQSLSTAQQAFAAAYRGLQLEGTLYAFCIIPIQPQMEVMLGLTPQSLSQDILLSKRVFQLLLEYNISPDLLCLGERDRGVVSGESAIDARYRGLKIVAGNVEKVSGIIESEERGERERVELRRQMRRAKRERRKTKKRIAAEEEETRRLHRAHVLWRAEDTLRRAKEAREYAVAFAKYFEQSNQSIESVVENNMREYVDEGTVEMTQASACRSETAHAAYNMVPSLSSLVSPFFASGRANDRQDMILDCLDEVGVCQTEPNDAVDSVMEEIMQSMDTAAEINHCLSATITTEFDTDDASLEARLNALAQDTIGGRAGSYCDGQQDAPSQTQTHCPKKTADATLSTSTVTTTTTSSSAESGKNRSLGDPGGKQSRDEPWKREVVTSSVEDGRACFDVTKIPNRLDKKLLELDRDGAVRPALLKPGEEWGRVKRHMGGDCIDSGRGLGRKKGKSLAFGTEDREKLEASGQEKEWSDCRDLLDYLTRSGALAIDCADLHVLFCCEHQFTHNILDTLVEESVNPIERIAESLAIILEQVHGEKASL